MIDSQEEYDAKCPALEAHEADREPTVEERLEAFEYALRGGEQSEGMLRHTGANLCVDALALIRSQAKEIERLRGTVFVCERDVDGVKASVHMGQHCESCGHTSRFEASHCPECGVARP